MPAAQEHLLLACLNSAHVVMAVKDAEGRNLMVNDTLAKMFGCSKEELVGKTDQELHSQNMSEVEAWAANDQKVREAQRPMTFKEYGTFQGKRRTYLAHKFPVSIEGHPHAIGSIILDMTECE